MLNTGKGRKICQTKSIIDRRSTDLLLVLMTRFNILETLAADVVPYIPF
jgi:hypothetical protein